MNIDASMCRVLRTQGLEAINKALSNLGLAATFTGGMTYSPAGINTKITVIPLDAGKDAAAALAEKAKTEYIFGARFLGLPADSFGRTFVHGGKYYKITGLVGGRSNRVHIARQPDGKVFVMNAAAVLTGLNSTFPTA